MLENLLRPGHLLIILAIVLLVFGPGKLPQVGSALGKSIRDFKKAMNGGLEEPEAPAQSQVQAQPAEKKLPEKTGA